MRRSLLRASLLAAALAACADDSSTITETHAPNGATIIGGRDPLTPPSAEPRDVIIREFLKTRGAGSAVDQLRVVRESSPVNGIVHVTMEQFANGLRIYDAYVKAAINSQGQLIQVIDNVVRPKPTASPLTISEAAALDAARAELGYDATIALYRAPRIERVAYVDDNGTLREGYVVETWTLTDNKLDETLVGHNGHVVAVQARSASDSYNVFVEDPGKNAQTVVAGGPGWLFAGDQLSQHIRGNNVSAYVDADANNAPDSGGSTVTDGNFLAAADFASSPGTANNKDVAVQNLFYLNNVAHDVLYAAGFNEAEGNFQQDNFGLGGAGNDAVKAEAQDGSGTDNANFSTPSDGSAPRMQMYLWSPLGTHEVITSGGTYAASGAAFGPALTTTGMSGDVVGVSTDGCGAVSGVSGKIALIDRGNCDFTIKVMNAQTAGATAVIIANNAGDSMFEMGGNNRKIKIPSVMVGQTSGAALRAAPTAATLRKDPTPPPMVDADLDSDIVFHEYGHGLSWRMIGGMSGPMSGAIGEGASDTLAFLINGDSAVAEYSASDSRGIRRFVYEGYPNTYSDMCAGGCQVHNDGEIYAAAMWRLRSLYLANGLSSDALLGDWVQGMRYTPASPAFENMRDGLVQALSVSAPERTCLVWQAFAAQGIGVGAKGVLGRGGRTVVVTESFAVPAECAAP